MSRSRTLHARARIAAIALLALLWSQWVVAGHAGCLAMPVPMEPAQVHVMSQGCPEPPAVERAICDAHCGQDEAPPESMRLPAFPPAMAVPAIPVIDVLVIMPGASGIAGLRIARWPPPSWHRPTAHPASLLLI